MSRADLAATVWDDASPDAARASLRTALVGLRATVPDTLSTEGPRISIIPGRVVQERGEGEFMPGFDELWALDERLRQRSEAVEALLLAARASDDDTAALDLVQRACTIDPLHLRSARFRERLLRRIGRPEEALRKGASFRIRFVREFGSAPEPPPALAISDHPLIASAEWTLERDPDEACSLLAGSQVQWTTVAVDRALEIHERTLNLSRRPGPERNLVEAWTWCLRVLNGKVSQETETLIERQHRALAEKEPLVACRLTDAVAYACLSRGEFAEALAYARKGAQLARHRLDPIGVAGAELTLAIIEQHTGHPELSARRNLKALRLIEEHGGPTSIAMHEIVRTGTLIVQGRYDEAFVLVEKCRRLAQTLSAARMMPWVLHLEAQLYEATGELSTARVLLEELRETAANAGQPAVAIADDSLFRVNCMLGELDVAVDALARGTMYRKRMGTVPSRYERTQLAPSVRVIREKLDPRDLAAAFRRAAAAS